MNEQIKKVEETVEYTKTHAAPEIDPATGLPVPNPIKLTDLEAEGEEVPTHDGEPTEPEGEPE